MMNCTVNTTCVSATSTTLFFDLGILDICMYIINVLFGFPTYSYIIWLIITTGSGISSEFFFLNLSLCEIGICLLFLIFLFDHFPFSQYLTEHLMGLKMFLQGLCITGRPLFQSLICVERYLAVVHPVTFLKYKPLRYRLMCSAVVWLMIVGSCVFSMFYIMIDSSGSFNLFFLLQFLFFLSIQLFCCLAVLRGLKQSGPGERGREREEENHMKRRAFHLILITTMSMFITYALYIFSGFFILLSQNNMVELWTFSFICFVSGGFVLPVLYLQRTASSLHKTPLQH